LAGNGPYQIDVFDVSDLDEIGWPNAADDSTWSLFVFQSREFLKVWFETIGAARESEAHLVVVRNVAGEAVFYLPLCLERRFGVKILRFPDGGVSDYCAPIVRPGSVLEPRVFRGLWQQILAAIPEADLIHLRNLPDRIIDTPNPLLALGLGMPQGLGSYISVNGGWQVYSREPARQAVLSQAAKKLRKLMRHQAVTFQQASLATCSDWIDFILEQKRRQYLRTLGEDVIALPGHEAFFRRMAAPEQLGCISTLDCLLVGNEIAAGHLGYATGRRSYYILTATNYDVFAKYSLGTSLFSHLVQQSLSRSKEIYDLGIGIEPYKDVWATDRYALYSYVKPLTLKGRLATSAFTLKHSPLTQVMRRLRARPGLAC